MKIDNVVDGINEIVDERVILTRMQKFGCVYRKTNDNLAKLQDFGLRRVRNGSRSHRLAPSSVACVA